MSRMSTTDVLVEVLIERVRQDGLWGQQNHPGPHWASILGEEFGEVCKALNDTLSDRAPLEHDTRTELIQTAAVAVAWIEAIDREMRLQ